MSIQKIAVIGSGVMGSGIAAHIANAGVPVLLFDVENPLSVVHAMRAKGPSGALMDPARADLIEACSLGDDLARLNEADWICEVIVENLAIKRDLYARIETHRKDSAIISSNTSTIPLARLVEERSDGFRQHFLITHFFNPPRQMRLLELVTGPDTLAYVRDAMHAFCTVDLGKGVVDCYDRPGFIANRIGNYWMMLALHTAIAEGVDIDAADAALAKGYGIPKTGVFGLMDLIGLDLIPKMVASLVTNLPANDALHSVAQTPNVLAAMIAAGYTGRKGKGGFTRLVKDEAGGKIKYSLKLDADFNPDSSYAVAHKGHDASEWAKSVMDKTLAYAASLLGEVAANKEDIDAAMVWGYGWKAGPFALLGDKIEMPRPAGAIFVQDFAHKLISDNDHAALYDTGDKIAVLTMKTKMNVFDTGVFDLIDRALDMDLAGMIVATDGPHFSAGANINRFLERAVAQDWDGLQSFILMGQNVMKKLRASHFPVVVALNGYVMGGACELSLHASAIIAHAETNIGLVEPRVGVIPAWGGCLEALRRMGAVQALKTILAQWTSASALDAKARHFLAPDCEIVMNRDLVLAHARRAVMQAAAPKPRLFAAATVQERIDMERWLESSDYDAHNKLIGQYLIEALCAPNEDSLWQAECDGFMALMRTSETIEKIKKMV